MGTSKVTAKSASKIPVRITSGLGGSPVRSLAGAKFTSLPAGLSALASPVEKEQNTREAPARRRSSISSITSLVRPPKSELRPKTPATTPKLPALTPKLPVLVRRVADNAASAVVVPKSTAGQKESVVEQVDKLERAILSTSLASRVHTDYSRRSSRSSAMGGAQREVGLGLDTGSLPPSSSMVKRSGEGGLGVSAPASMSMGAWSAHLNRRRNSVQTPPPSSLQPTLPPLARHHSSSALLLHHPVPQHAPAAATSHAEHLEQGRAASPSHYVLRPTISQETQTPAEWMVLGQSRAGGVSPLLALGPPVPLDDSEVGSIKTIGQPARGASYYAASPSLYSRASSSPRSIVEKDDGDSVFHSSPTRTILAHQRSLLGPQPPLTVLEHDIPIIPIPASPILVASALPRPIANIALAHSPAYSFASEFTPSASPLLTTQLDLELQSSFSDSSSINLSPTTPMLYSPMLLSPSDPDPIHTAFKRSPLGTPRAEVEVAETTTERALFGGSLLASEPLLASDLDASPLFGTLSMPSWFDRPEHDDEDDLAEKEEDEDDLAGAGDGDASESSRAIGSTTRARITLGRSYFLAKDRPAWENVAPRTLETGG